MSEQIIPASRKRVLLALYLDYLVLSPILALGLYLSTGQFEVPTWQELIVLSIYEAILYYVTDSPGFRFLSIRKIPRSMVVERKVERKVSEKGVRNHFAVRGGPARSSPPCIPTSASYSP